MVTNVTLEYPIDNWELGVDYTATAEFDSENVGTRNANVVVTLIGNTGNNCKLKNNINTLNATGNITPQNIEGANITVVDDTIEYNGNEKKPDVIVTKNGNQLEKDVDFDVEYENNINVGDNAIVIVNGKNNYNGSAQGTFTISPYTISENNVSLEYTRTRYTGEYKEPAADVYINGHKMPSSEYTVSFISLRQLSKVKKSPFFLEVSNKYFWIYARKSRFSGLS